MTRSVIGASTATVPSCPLPRGFVRSTQIGFVGHSDGAEAVGLFSFAVGTDPQGRSYQALRGEIGARATIVMSGGPDGINAYRAPLGGSDLLVIQSAADRCNPFGHAVQFYDSISETDKFSLSSARPTTFPHSTGRTRRRSISLNEQPSAFSRSRCVGEHPVEVLLRSVINPPRSRR